MFDLGDLDLVGVGELSLFLCLLGEGCFNTRCEFRFIRNFFGGSLLNSSGLLFIDVVGGSRFCIIALGGVLLVKKEFGS